MQGAKATDLVALFIDDSREDPRTISAAHALLNASVDDRDACDELLARHARNWDLPRLALVDRNILRLACRELREGGTSYRIVISEALKLAHEFSSAEAPRFINGILDAVAREISDRPGGD